MKDSEMTAMGGAVEARERLEGELETARATNRRLHRRCQQAEGAVPERIVQTEQIGKTRTLGRVLANAAASVYRREAMAHFEEAKRLRGELEQVATHMERGPLLRHEDLAALAAEAIKPRPHLGHIPDLEEEIQKFRERLRSSLGHSNCYCARCKDLTARFWWPLDSESGPPGLSHAEARKLGAEKHWPGEPEIQGP